MLCFFFINCREAIAAIIGGGIVVFYNPKRSIGFLWVFFKQEIVLFTRQLDLNLKTKVRKSVMVNSFSQSEKFFFDHALRSVDDSLTLKNFLERTAHYQYTILRNSCNKVLESLIIFFKCKMGSYCSIFKLIFFVFH